MKNIFQSKLSGGLPEQLADHVRLAKSNPSLHQSPLTAGMQTAFKEAMRLRDNGLIAEAKRAREQNTARRSPSAVNCLSVDPLIAEIQKRLA